MENPSRSRRFSSDLFLCPTFDSPQPFWSYGLSKFHFWDRVMLCIRGVRLSQVGVLDCSVLTAPNADALTTFCKCYTCCRSIRVQIRVDTILVRDVPEGQQRIPAYFSTPIYDVDDTQHLDLQEVTAHLSKQLDDFNRRGSGFVLEHIAKCTICIAQYCPYTAPVILPRPSGWPRNKLL